MKKFFLVTALMALFFALPMPARAGVNINLGLALPPPVVAATPPAMVVLPGAAGVYAAPGVSADLFFWNGWWWRPWNGHWYRSRSYDRGWGYYRSGVPGFYHHVNPRWRGSYSSRHWNGHPWHYTQIPYRSSVRGHHGHYRH